MTHVDRGGSSPPIHVFQRGDKDHICARGTELVDVVGFVARVCSKVLIRSELQRIDEDARNHYRIGCVGCTDKRQMTLVKSAHCCHESDLAFGSCDGELGTELVGRPQYLHRPSTNALIVRSIEESIRPERRAESMIDREAAL